MLQLVDSNGWTPADPVPSGNPLSTVPVSPLALPLLVGANLADVANPAAGRINLELGGAAVRDVGTSAGTVAAGDDARIAGGLEAVELSAALAKRTASLEAMVAVLGVQVAREGTILAGTVQASSLSAALAALLLTLPTVQPNQLGALWLSGGVLAVAPSTAGTALLGADGARLTSPIDGAPLLSPTGA